MLAYEALKRAITEMDIYGTTKEFRLDERQLSEDLGVSRTPIREAMTVLEQEGFVRSVPRRGIFVVRKTKREIFDLIVVWAALESMAARLAAVSASADDIKGLRRLFNAFREETAAEQMNEYSQANIAFHQAILRMGGCRLIVAMTGNLFLHMRAIRAVSIRQENRLEISQREHTAIIDALEARDAERAERLVREHAMGLAAHVDKHGMFPD
ncbi:GntR family transcriptional regulator [Xanthobacter sp. KR7-225]|uniref:GntR family transcriptional regulator n=1 Tax=Xanthobacter sp. KR7-225 TaxID=3156613 RepID=UPI0032B4C244